MFARMERWLPLALVASAAIAAAWLEWARRRAERRRVDEQNRRAREQLAGAARELGLGAPVEAGKTARERTFSVRGSIEGLPTTLTTTPHGAITLRMECALVGLPAGLLIAPALQGRSQEDYLLGTAIPAPADEQGIPWPFCVAGSTDALAHLAATLDPKFYAFASVLAGRTPSYAVRLDSAGVRVDATRHPEDAGPASATIVRVWRSTETAIRESHRLGIVLSPQ